MPFNDMTIRWEDILGQLAHSTTMFGYLRFKFPRGYHVPHCVGNPHWRIPNSLVGTNSLETRRSSSLSLKKLIELIWHFKWLHSKGLGRCRILRWVSLGNHFPVLPRPPLTIQCFLWLKKEKMKLRKQKTSRSIILSWISKSSRSHQFLHFQSPQENQSF